MNKSVGQDQLAAGLSQRLKPQEFESIRRLAYEKFGLDLRKGKEELVAARLGKRMREGGFDSFEQYYQHVVSDPSGEALIGMIDSLATNHTSFLREAQHFDFLRQSVLPALRERPRAEFWSAACSTGEEPYTLAFMLCDAWGIDAFRRVRILATDISTKALTGSRNAVYPEERFTTVPSGWLRQYLLRGEGRWKGWYRVKPELRSQIEFTRLNLIEPFSHAQLFPVIFCRNVMIYFDKATQETLVNRLANCLEPGGYLFIGHAESLTGVHHGLSYVRPAIYQKPAGGGGRGYKCPT
ncbi:MAG TPA: protein-glutamate O-methyltransferase CheR [Bryobacteraceae bacterium]|nr:protein-glutamate O-methyltransferase CheR [Bryobacteraceae bacterium]